MGSDLRLSLSLFVAQGRERETAEFYKAVFGAEEIGAYEMMRLQMIELQFGDISITVCGSDPAREIAPGYHGPFHPNMPGAVSSIFQLTIADVNVAVEIAAELGGSIRDKVQVDMAGRRAASIYDPAGHIWVLTEEATEDTETED